MDGMAELGAGTVDHPPAHAAKAGIKPQDADRVHSQPERIANTVSRIGGGTANGDVSPPLSGSYPPMPFLGCAGVIRRGIRAMSKDRQLHGETLAAVTVTYSIYPRISDFRMSPKPAQRTETARRLPSLCITSIM
jgi:hypothetical protein